MRTRAAAMTESRPAGPAGGRPERSRRRTFLALAACWALVGAVNAVWLRRDTRPPTWDPSNHLLSETRYRNLLADAAAGRVALPAAARALLRVDDHYPPLAPLAAAAASSPFPARPDPAILVLAALASGLLIVAVHGIGSALFSPETGAIAAVAAVTFPLVAGQSRQFMLDVPDAAMTSLAILALLRTDGFRRTGRSLLFGAVLGLALLTKWTCAFFVALPLAAAIAVGFRAPDRRRRLALAAAAVLAAAAIAAPWYFAHLWSLWRDTGKFAYAVGVREGDPPVGSLRSLAYYPAALVAGAGWAWTALFAAGAVFAAVRERARSAVLFLWLGGGAAILTLIRNKDPRYLMPMLPAVALLAASSVSRVRGSAVRIAFTAVLAAAGLAAAWRRDPPRQERWPVADAVSWIRSASGAIPRPRLRVVPDLPRFERHAFEYEAEAARFPLDVGTWFRFPAFTDFVLTKSGAQGERPEPAAIMRSVDDPAGSFRGVFRPRWEKPLPDGSVATIWARDPSPVPESGAAVAARLESAVRETVGRYASGVDGLAVAVESRSDEDARRGRFSRIAIALRSARIRPKPGAREALLVSDAALEVRGAAIDAPALMRTGEIRVLALEEVLPRLVTTQESVGEYLAARNPRGRIAVRFSAGRIEASGRWGAAPAVDLAVTPRIVASNVEWSVDRVRLAGIPFPASALEALLSGNNPILKPMPCRVRLETLDVDRGKLALNRRDAVAGSRASAR